ncbi:hypothetical protein CPB83DRAFT_860059 [Crepidotus variabilis]|uniref:Steroid 5-alpha reductase C-terminal domain-containing protein n=1 Tax=Crepidotus variabilis TaxID=179855 RepID=A0A9P6EA24_9AGAR|nr:hypothetical protein CPB83DRAFT_860059 [Crepidotus variabilis]
MSSPAYKPPDNIARGQKHSTPLGTSAFVIMRLLDPLIQHTILSTSVGPFLLEYFHLKPLADDLPINTGIAVLDSLNISPYRLLLLAMVLAGSLKQIYNQLVTSEEALPLMKSALPLGFYPGAISTVHSLLAISSASGGQPGGKTTDVRLCIATFLFVVGIIVETLSETQRKKFKANPQNRGKLCTTGWWSIARHINYAGFIVWRTGFGLAAAGWAGGIGSFLFYFSAMNQGAISSLNSYAGKKYGQQWEAYKRKTPYKLFPGLW